MRAAATLLALLAMLAGCGGVFLATPVPQTWIGVQGPLGWQPPEDLSLELAGSAWSITSQSPHGVVAITTSKAVEVTLWGASTCRRYTSFEAPPGSLYRIVFVADGSVAIHDISGQAIEMGPALVERTPTACEASSTSS